MNLSTLKPVLTRTLGRTLLQAQKHSPEILVAAGIAGFVTAGVLAAKATLKLEPIVDEHEAHVEIAKSITTIDETRRKKDLVKIHRRTAFELTKLYGPSVTLAVASTACIIGAHGIMHKRNVALALAYKGLEQIHTEYRKRVEEEFGTEKERQFHYGVHEEEQVNEETGKKELVQVRNPRDLSLYARFFGEDNINWRSSPDYNLTFIRGVQDMANMRLRTRGHVFLNEVYDWLGLERTTVGAMAGWLYEQETGDDYIDFGLYDNVANSAAFVAGTEKSVWLDFNCDGSILNKI